MTAALTLLTLSCAPAGAEGPIDRQTVVMPPAYPAPSSGFLRLPDTTSTPVPPPPPVAAGNGNLLDDRGVPFPAPAAPSPGPAWTPSRLEPAPGIDARGRPGSVLEYTPGRFTR